MQWDLYWSHDFPLQSFSDSGNGAYSQLRNDSESPAYSYSLGARFGFIFPSGMGLKLGLNYSKVNINASLDPTAMGMDSTSTGSVSVKNGYSYVDIPLLFTIEKSGFGPFYLNFNGGVLFNMAFSSKGQIYDEAENIRFIGKGQDNRFKIHEDAVGASLYASVGFHYLWNRTVDFILEPNIRFGISPLTLSDAPIDERITTVGLITGLRYKF